MSEIPIYLRAPTTSRSALELAYAAGFESVDAFAEQLPQGAQVLDVGAGFSWLGCRVAELRSDITWRNVDYMYNPEAIKKLDARSPDNVVHLQGDAQVLTDIVPPESQDMVFSYWLLPHLSLHESSVALRAGRQMYTVAKPDSKIIVGPKCLRHFWGSQALTWSKNATLDAEQFAQEAHEATMLRGIMRIVQMRHNENRTWMGKRLPGESEATPEKESTRKLLGQLANVVGDVAATTGSYLFWSTYLRVTRQLVVEPEL